MILIDGRQIDRDIAEFNNLEEILKAIMAEEAMEGRIITDVLVNDENFSEIYPHQAEDMACDSIQKVEVKSEVAKKMAIEMSGELDKVARMMEAGGKNVSKLFRDGKDSEALELLQDLLDVTRDFMGILAFLRDKYLGGADEEFVAKVESFSSLISEMSDVLEDEDLILLADLIEFEFVPFCGEWLAIGQKIHAQLAASAG